MSRAEKIVRWTLTNEGGWSNHPADRGGKTKYGITESTARAHGFDVRTLTEADAIRIYLEDYWRWEWVLDTRLAAKLFDIGVNMGLTWAIRLLQRALRMLGNTRVLEDGILGPVTRGSTNGENPAALLATLTYCQMQRYFDIVAAAESQRVFLRGWLTRANKPVTL